MQRFLGLAFLSCLVLVGCSSTGHESIASGSTLTTQIASLERTQQQMRKQYDALGETLTRLETRIAALKGQQDRNFATLPPPTASEPAPHAAPARTSVTTTVTKTVTGPTPENLAQQPVRPANAPTTLVGDLTDQDMEVQAAPAAAIAPAATAPQAVAAVTPAPARATVGNRPQTYLVHLASYLDSAPVKPGWRQISSKNAAELKGLTPYVTPFSDGQNRRWLRLSAGPFNSSSEAHGNCNALKAAGSWCDVLQVATSSMRELR